MTDCDTCHALDDLAPVGGEWFCPDHVQASRDAYWRENVASFTDAAERLR